MNTLLPRKQRIIRWASPLAAGLFFLMVLCLELTLRIKGIEAGLMAWIKQSLNTPFTRSYILSFFTHLLLPFYLCMGLILWLTTLLWGASWVRGWIKAWRPTEAFFLSFCGLLWAHVILWAQVPTTLWVLPILNRLPFFLTFGLFGLSTLAYPVYWMHNRGVGKLKGTGILAGWLALWSVFPLLPQKMPRLLSTARGGTQPTSVLLIGLDGLRSDTGLQNTKEWVGLPYLNAYTPIPATRLLWHILWGGDPAYFTVGHATPGLEEFDNGEPVRLIREAADKHWKPRFYIDDGGTIGLAGRDLGFDDVLMPARGWENFASSNLMASFPLFASWENWSRAFPTTNPWAPLDMGLREALRLGRGSRWVSFHSCLAHQPIFLRREELDLLPKWWSLTPHQMEPISIRYLATPEFIRHWDARANPFTAYQIRMHSILEAWKPIWNGLDTDPNYSQATRVLFSDHGERFYHVTPEIQLQGVHGYGLTPWETRVMTLVAGPGFPNRANTAPETATLSLMALRDGIARVIRENRPITQDFLKTAYPQAPMRYQTLGVELFETEPAEYKQMDTESLIAQTYIAPDGIWFTKYSKPPSERAADISVALGDAGRLLVYKPLKAGGAHCYHYENLALNGIEQISESEFNTIKREVEASMPALAPFHQFK